MDKEKMKFWVTCPVCKKKFGINGQTVLKYIQRVIGSIGGSLTNNKGNNRQKQGSHGRG